VATEIAMGTVFVSGIFNVLHPGHVRLLRFARELGDRLVVGVIADELAEGVATVSQTQRLDAVRSLRMVDEAFIVEASVAEAIAKLRPEVVVKGREHLSRENVEEPLARSYGGRLVFSSGDSFFSATDLISQGTPSIGTSSIDLPVDFMAVHGIATQRLINLLDDMASLKVLVVGDVIVDEYVSCHPLGMSREDPTLVVTPIETTRFIGGAAIVAGHAASLGRGASLHSVVGEDEQAEFLRSQLQTQGVVSALHVDRSRPTTNKQRWRAGGKTLLRVSHLHQDPIPSDVQATLLASVERAIDDCDAIIFSDFNYGCLPQALVDGIQELGALRGLVLAADSQTSSQIGDISRFKGMTIVTPTEYEARVATRNFDDGLVVLADELRERAEAQIVLMTLAEDGVFIRGASTPGGTAATERLPALNPQPMDVAGAGDSLLVTAAMALAVGASMHEAALLGSLSAALQVSTIGNRPLSREALLQAISR
jgi:rfaE bifunctional protein kinase chain/domain